MPPIVASRRRVLALVGVAAGLTLASWERAAHAAAPTRLRWTGSALGAQSQIDLYHPDPERGREILGEAVAEIRRLESIFSLTRQDSALVQLNRTGTLQAPPPELVELLQRAAWAAQISNGAFDATVQPLWTLYARHFAPADADPAGPSADSIAQARALVDWRAVDISSEQIVLSKPGMAVTLNGIAGGYISDAVIAKLRAAGITHVLADVGEMRGLGHHPDGQPWRVGLADPNRPESVLRLLEIENSAIASSGGYGTIFEPTGRFHHLFNPHSGGCADVWAGTTVQATDATTADALSTALAVAPREAARGILAAGGGQQAWLIDRKGTIVEI